MERGCWWECGNNNSQFTQKEEYRMNTGKENDVFEVIIDVKDPLQLLGLVLFILSLVWFVNFIFLFIHSFFPQKIVQNSKLTLKEGSKNQLQGFYDPCPQVVYFFSSYISLFFLIYSSFFSRTFFSFLQEPKNLEIKYKFNGCAYKVTINDTAPLNLPSSSLFSLSFSPDFFST